MSNAESCVKFLAIFSGFPAFPLTHIQSILLSCGVAGRCVAFHRSRWECAYVWLLGFVFYFASAYLLQRILLWKPKSSRHNRALTIILVFDHSLNIFRVEIALFILRFKIIFQCKLLPVSFENLIFFIIKVKHLKKVSTSNVNNHSLTWRVHSLFHKITPTVLGNYKQIRIVVWFVIHISIPIFITLSLHHVMKAIRCNYLPIQIECDVFLLNISQCVK